MKFTYRKYINIKVGQKFYGIIAVSSRTYDGIYPVTVEHIDWNTNEIVFTVDQPCGEVYCAFREFNRYVFESEKEGQLAMKSLRYGEGLHAL